MNSTSEIGLPELTNENWYEFSWKVRELVLEKILESGRRDVASILHALTDFDIKHAVHIPHVDAHDKVTGKLLGSYLTGEFKVQALDLPDADAATAEAEADIRRRMDDLSRWIEDDVDVVAELGCGYGHNIFLLHEINAQRRFRYLAAEYTEAGRRICQRIAGFLPEARIDVAFVDHKDLDTAIFESPEKAFVFTCHSLEQVNLLPETYFWRLAKVAPKVRGVHMEPFGFQLDQSTAAAKRHKEWFEGKGWNVNLYERIREAERDGLIEILELELNKYYPQPNNPTSVVVWEATN
jgi:Zn ribbon nucleic-acid-binding protein